MLSDHPATPVLAVTDLERAKAYYEDTLGFVPDANPGPEGVVYTAGGVRFLVYQSSYAGTNRATAIGFQIPPDAFDAEVADLRARGVTFETYDMPEVVFQDGVATYEGMRTAWFEDPFGNILNIESGTP